jgi:hypothetical protein
VPALSSLASPEPALTVLSQLLFQEATTLASVDEAAQRTILAAEQAELADRKIFAAARETAIKRRDLLKLDALYLLALAEVQTTGITKKANDLVDVHQRCLHSVDDPTSPSDEAVMLAVGPLGILVLHCRDLDHLAVITLAA